MSTTLKNTLAGFAVAALLLVGAGSAKAATMAELQQMIADLTAQLAALSGGSSCNAGTYNHTVTLKQGSMGSQVVAMQKVIGAIPDGNFGPQTKAKVATFQSGKGLTADGVVGPMTGAALHTASMINCDADDDSSDDDSSDDDDNGPLSGDFGTMSDVNTLSQYSSEDVGEGEEDVKIAGFEVEASNDGDIMLTSMKISFDPTGNDSGDSDHLDDYIDGVTIWMGDDEVGSADVDDFTENSDDTYSRTIQLDDSVVRADDTEKFYISVDAAGNLDSGDIDSDSWTIDVNNIRYEDGDGVVTTDTTAGDLDGAAGTIGGGVEMDFVDFGTAADTELQISTDSASPDAGIVVIDNTDSTDNILLLTGSLELEGDSDIVIDEFPVTLTTSGATDLDEITGSLTLIIDGEEYTESVSTSALTTTTVTFNNMDFDMSAGATIDFEVRAEINDIETGLFEEGDMLKADVSASNRGAIDAENEEGDQLHNTSERSGTAVGEYQEFRTQGISLSLVEGETGAEVTAGSSANDDIGVFTITFEVTAVGDTVYVGTTVAQGYTYTADLAGTTTTSGITAVIANHGGDGNSTTATSQGNWRIEENSTVELALTVQRTAGTPLPSSGLWRASLTGVKWSSSDGDTTLENTYSSDMDDFRTEYVGLN